MMKSLIKDCSGSSAAEFALVLPLLLTLLFGTIDAGRWIWTYNRAEKATQMGVRMAVVTDPISPGVSASFLGVGGLTQGDIIPPSAFGKITCTGSGNGTSVTATCTCTVSPCPTLGTANSTEFQTILARMKAFLPELSASNLVVEYSSSGLGYAGDPYGRDLSPVVTVKIGAPATQLQFTPITSFLFWTIPMPGFAASLTAEDLAGSQSN